MAATYTVGDGKTYSTIQAAVDAIPGVLTGEGTQTVEVYAKAPSNIYQEKVDARTGFSGNDTNNYIHTVAMVAHKGIAGNGITIDANGNANAYVHHDYGRLEGFCITQSTPSTAAASYAILAELNVTRTYNCIIHDWVNNTTGFSIGIFAGRGSLVYNNFIYKVTNLRSAAGASGIFLTTNGAKIYNNTVWDVVTNGGTQQYGIVWYNTHASSELINNYSGDSANKDFKAAGGPNPGTITCNISSDGTANDWGGAGNLVNKAASNQFVSLAGDSEDFHLKSDADCIDAGTSISGEFTTDIDGQTRSGTWDVGADEYIAPGGVDRHIALDGYFIEGGNVTVCIDGLLEV